MKFETIRRRAAAATLAVGLALMLTGCFLSPGKFTSTLDLRTSGQFTFTYQGEIYFLGLSRLASMAGEAEEVFVASTCYDEEGDFEVIECSEEELERQREEWEAGKEAREAENERNSKMASAMFGGIDPSDPAAAEEVATKLRRQHGWNNVEYKGDGLYVVDFSITSTMTHDFTFPVFEGFAFNNGFVVANLRDGNVVRIEAPGYSGQTSSATSGTGLMQVAALMGDEENGGDEAGPTYIPELDGSFTITTDGAILANNTDEGPAAVPGGQKLAWSISKRSTAAPMALIRLGN